MPVAPLEVSHSYLDEVMRRVEVFLNAVEDAIGSDGWDGFQFSTVLCPIVLQQSSLKQSVGTLAKSPMKPRPSQPAAEADVSSKEPELVRHLTRKQSRRLVSLNSDVFSSLEPSLVRRMSTREFADDRAAWEHRIAKTHVAALESSAGMSGIESFSSKAELEYCLYSVFFHTIVPPSMKAGLVSPEGPLSAVRIYFHDLRAVMLSQQVVAKQTELATDAKNVALIKAIPCRELYHVKKMLRLRLTTRDQQPTSGVGEAPMYAFTTSGDVTIKLRVITLSPGHNFETRGERELPRAHGTVMSLGVCLIHSPMQECKHKLLIVATSDGVIRGYDARQLERLKFEASMRCMQSLLVGVEWMQLLVAGGSNGVLSFFDVSKLSRLSHRVEDVHRAGEKLIVTTLQAHDDGIMSYTINRSKNTLYTGGIDRKIAVVDLRTMTLVQTLNGHKVPVMSVTYNVCQNALVSCGAEPTIYVWPLEMLSKLPGLMLDLVASSEKGYCQVETVPNAPAVIALDTFGSVQVWDVNTMRCVSTVSCEPDLTRSVDDFSGKGIRAGGSDQWSWMQFDPVTKEVFTAAKRKLYVLLYDAQIEGLHPMRAHDGAVTAALYDSSSRFVYSCAKAEVQIWRASTTRALCKLSHVTQTRISSMLLVAEDGFLVLGTENGVISFVLLSSMSSVAEYAHSGADKIVALCSASAADGAATVVFAQSRAGHVDIITLVSSDGEGGVPHGERVGGSRVLAATSIAALQGKYAQPWPMLLVGGLASHFYVFHVVDRDQSASDMPKGSPSTRRKGKRGSAAAQTPQQQSSLQLSTVFDYSCRNEKGSSAAAITAVAPLDTLSCVVLGDAQGHLFMWGYNDVTMWPICHWPIKKSSNPTTHIVSRLDFVAPMLLLYVGDGFGVVTVFDLDQCLLDGGSIADDACSSDLAGSDMTVRVPAAGSVMPGAPQHSIASWTAHAEGEIISLQVILAPLAVLTGSSDGCVQLWTLAGSPIGIFVTPFVRATLSDSDFGLDFTGIPAAGAELAGGLARLQSLSSFSRNASFKKRQRNNSSWWITEFNGDAPPPEEVDPVERYNDLPFPFGAANGEGSAGKFPGGEQRRSSAILGLLQRTATVLASKTVALTAEEREETASTSTAESSVIRAVRVEDSSDQGNRSTVGDDPQVVLMPSDFRLQAYERPKEIHTTSTAKQRGPALPDGTPLPGLPPYMSTSRMDDAVSNLEAGVITKLYGGRETFAAYWKDSLTKALHDMRKVDERTANTSSMSTQPAPSPLRPKPQPSLIDGRVDLMVPTSQHLVGRHAEQHQTSKNPTIGTLTSNQKSAVKQQHHIHPHAGPKMVRGTSNAPTCLASRPLVGGARAFRLSPIFSTPPQSTEIRRSVSCEPTSLELKAKQRLGAGASEPQHFLSRNGGLFPFQLGADDDDDETSSSTLLQPIIAHMLPRHFQ